MKAAADFELVNRVMGKNTWDNCYVKTSGDIEKTLACIEEHNGFKAENLYDGIEEGLQETTLLFTGIFIVIALIILFVASGMSEHIVRERMAQLGTLRSIGAARSLTTLLPISENLFYGLVEAAVGILVYTCGKPLLYIFVSSSVEMNYNSCRLGVDHARGNIGVGLFKRGKDPDPRHNLRQREHPLHTLNVYSHQFQTAQARVAEAMDGAFDFLQNKQGE